MLQFQGEEDCANTLRDRTNGPGSGYSHLKSWVVETSVDGKNWWEIAHEENNQQLNGGGFVGNFSIADGRDCCFIRLVNIGRNHFGADDLLIAAWEIFRGIIEWPGPSSRGFDLVAAVTKHYNISLPFAASHAEII